MNFLEQLVAEWYAYKGYFVDTNIRIGRRPRGGFEGEIDVVAYDPKDKTLVHLEASSAADSWERRRKKFRKKFDTARKYYKSIFRFKYRGIKQVAIVGFARPKRDDYLGKKVELISIPEMIALIAEEMKKFSPTKKAIPEKYPLLRVIQFATWYGSQRELRKYNTK